MFVEGSSSFKSSTDSRDDRDMPQQQQHRPTIKWYAAAASVAVSLSCVIFAVRYYFSTTTSSYLQQPLPMLAALSTAAVAPATSAAAAASTATTTSAALEIAYTASSRPYVPVPDDLELLSVVVVTRHGDRAQITRSLRASNTSAENATLTAFWKNALPAEATFRLMASAATAATAATAHPRSAVDAADKRTREEYQALLCTGWDREHTPYAMLTNLGALQLVAVGKELRRRYVGSLLPSTVEEAAEQLYCRSTNICRTTQSLRALLAGMYPRTATSSGGIGSKAGDASPADAAAAAAAATPRNATLNATHPTERALQRRSRRLPLISTRSKARENLFPAADGPCAYFAERRVKLYHSLLNASVIARWGTLEKRMKDVIGTTHRRIGWLTWLNILDVLTAFHAHNITFPDSVSYADLVQITDLVGWTWKVMYEDNMLARFAVGRFITDLTDNMDTSLNLTAPSSHRTGGFHGSAAAALPHDEAENATSSNSTREGHIHGSKMLLYSGHDSTMVPLLGAIGLYKGDWPPYASYLTLEVARLKKDKSAAVDPHGAAGHMYVRAVYNDVERVMEGCDGRMWCRYDLFKAQLSKTAWTYSQYQRECHSKNGTTTTMAVGPSGGGHHGATTADKQARHRRRRLQRSSEDGDSADGRHVRNDASQWL